VCCSGARRRHEGKEAEVRIRSDTDVRANTPALRVAAAWRGFMNNPG
jgi:hypothetical protein